MNRATIEKLLKEVQTGNLSIDSALERLKVLPYESLGFATLDHHRGIRQGFPEVIFCQGKTAAQVVGILRRMNAMEPVVLATRVEPTLARKIQREFKEAEYNSVGQTIVLRKESIPRRSGQITLVTAGTSDLPVAEEAKVTAELLGYALTTLYDVGVAGLHRLLNQMGIVEKADVVIVVAGMDGALPSVVGGLVGKPVIAVPSSSGYGTSFGGISALLTMLNSCAAGLAVVNIDNGFGAASLAHRILSLQDEQT